MDLFGKEKRELIDIIENLSETVMTQAGIISDLINPPSSPNGWADSFQLTIFYNGIQITSNKMSIQILDTQSVSFKATPMAKGIPSTIFPGSGIASPSDPSLFTIVLDAPDPGGAFISGTIKGVLSAVGVGAINVSGNADPSGKTVVTITGSDQVGVNAPPPVLADSFAFTYGTPA